MSKNGLLLINLGTPDEPTTASVRRYLREFLADPRVLDIHPITRFVLLNAIILPFRSSKSAAAYKLVWQERGSPLRFHSEDLAKLVAQRLGANWHVEFAMRYGKPSIASALEGLRAAHADRLVVFPLYPHYASSSTGSTLEEVFQQMGTQWNVANPCAIEAFYDAPAFIDCFAANGAPVIKSASADHVLFSFHGLPERQIRKSDETGQHCFASDACCDAIVGANRNCYRAQCFATARALAAALELEPGGWTISFQSRLGRSPWIAPYTDRVIPDLAARGVKRLAVFCPAFVADCLETLEEIQLRARDQFVSAGGESLTLVPSLNGNPAWADAVVDLIQQQLRRMSIEQAP